MQKIEKKTTHLFQPPHQLVKRIENFFELAPQLKDPQIHPNLPELQKHCEDTLRLYFLNLSTLSLLPLPQDKDPFELSFKEVFQLNATDKRKRIEQFLAEHPTLDRKELIEELNEVQKNITTKFGKIYRSEVPSTKFILHLFNLRQTTTQAFYIYQIPFQNKYNNDIDLLKTYIGKLQGFENHTARKIDQLIDNFKIHAPMTTPT